MTVEQLKAALEKLIEGGLGDTVVSYAEGIYGSPAESLTDTTGLHSISSVTVIKDVDSIDWELASAVWLS